MSGTLEIEQRSDVIFVQRDKLLEKLKENREKHKTEFEEASTKWREEATEALRKAADDAEAGKEIDLYPLNKLPKPVSYIGSYDEAILRVEMETRDELVLTEKQFAAWANDNWQWRDAFVGTTSLYNNAR